MGAQADAVARALTAHIETAAKALVLAITANLIKATPVDTGWARANWIPSIGDPVQAVAGSPTSVTPAEQQAGTARVLTYKLGNGLLYVSNNVPYIGILNYGTSKQAPAGFVELAIAQALQEVQQKFSVDFGLAAFVGDQGGEMAAGLASSYAPAGLS